MENKVIIVDYEEKYADIINEIEAQQLGKWAHGDTKKII